MSTTTVKLGLVGPILRGLDAAFPNRLPVALAMKKLKIAASLTKEHEVVRNMIRDIIETYAEKDDNGELIKSDPMNQDSFVISESNRANYEREMTELLDEQRSGPIEMFTEQDIEKAGEVNYDGLAMIIAIVDIPELQELFAEK